MRPYADSVAATASAQCAGSCALPATPIARSAPSPATAADGACASRPVTQTLSPRATSASAIPSPMPRLPPVMIATFPLYSATRSPRDVDDLAGHETRALADEKRDGVGDVLGR